MTSPLRASVTEPVAWSLATARDALDRILHEAGVPSLGGHVELRYARARALGVRLAPALEGARWFQVAATKLRADARALPMLERLRRDLGGDRWFCLDHPLHVALHQVGHVFEASLDARGLLDRAEARRHVGDLDLDTNPYPRGPVAYLTRAGTAWWHHEPRAALSAYATVHPCEAFAETFAVVALHGAKPARLRAFARASSVARAPSVTGALAWMAELLRAHEV